MSRIAIALIVAALCAGCESTPKRLEGSGVIVEPPYGYLKLCAEHPDFAGCPK